MNLKVKSSFNAFFLVAFSLLLMLSCSKESYEKDVNQLVEINVVLNNFKSISHPKSGQKIGGLIEHEVAVRNKINDPIKGLASTQNFASNPPVVVDVDEGVGYLVAAFDKISGKYAGEGFYIVGEDPIFPLKLPVGKEYIFVAFSYNSQGRVYNSFTQMNEYMIPNLTFTNPNVKTIQNALVKGGKNANNLGVFLGAAVVFDEFYYTINNTVPAISLGPNNLVDFTMEQKHCSITIEFDYSATDWTSFTVNRFDVSSTQVLFSQAADYNLFTNLFESNGAQSTVDYYDYIGTDPHKRFNFYLTGSSVVTDFVFKGLRKNNSEISGNLVVPDVTLFAGARYKLVIRLSQTQANPLISYSFTIVYDEGPAREVEF